MNRLADNLLQIVFVTGIIIVMIIIYVTRISGIRANDQIETFEFAYLKYQTVYQFQQEELRLQSKIRLLKAEYAAELTLFQSELEKVDSSLELSALEKREKRDVLRSIYSEQYFHRKLSLIDQERLILDNLLKTKCLKYCVYQDLPAEI